MVRKQSDSDRLKRELQTSLEEEPFYTSSQEPTSQQGNFDKETIAHRSDLRKPKTFKTLSAYDVCKQECRRQRDEESEKEYVERLRDELKFAEEQLIVQQKEREQNAQIQPAVANQQIPTV
uniref:Uncharacterized protein n=1 Tax=Ditylenchus dipsaci TaxID=166011 RepID=A0A915E1H2_9BILA